MALSFKIRKRPNYAVAAIKLPKMPNLKLGITKTKAIKLPKAKKLAILKAKVTKHVRI